MLTQEEINKIRSDAGASPIPTNRNTSTSLIDDLGLRDVEEPKPEEPSMLDNTIDGAKDIFNKGAESVKTTISEGASKLNEDISSEHPIVNSAKTIAETGLRTAGDVAGTAGELLTKPIETGSKAIADKVSDIGAVQRVANHPAVSKILDSINNGLMSAGEAVTKIKNEHPELSKDLGALFNISSLLVGEKPVQTAAESAAQGAKQLAEKTIAGTKSLAEKTVSKVGEKYNKVMGNTFEGSLAESKKIQNPYDKFNPTDNQSLYESGQIEKKGFGPFKKDVQAPKMTAQDETLSSLITDGKISSKKLPSENIKALKQETRVIDDNINELIRRPELNTPFNQGVVDKTLDSVKEAAQKSRVFISKSAEESAYNDVIDIAKEEIAKNSYNNSGLRSGIKSFNKRMEELLSSDIYKAEEGGSSSISQARIRAAQDVRGALNNQLGTSLDRAQTLNTLKVFKPREAELLVEKASNFPNVEDFIRSQEQSFREKILSEVSYRAEKRRIDRLVSNGMSLEDAWKKEGLSLNVNSDLDEIWQLAHTDVQSKGVGSLYRKKLQEEAHLLNAAENIAYNARGEVGKNGISRFVKKHPTLMKAASFGTAGILGHEFLK